MSKSAANAELPSTVVVPVIVPAVVVVSVVVASVVVASVVVGVSVVVSSCSVVRDRTEEVAAVVVTNCEDEEEDDPGTLQWQFSPFFTIWLTVKPAG